MGDLCVFSSPCLSVFFTCIYDAYKRLSSFKEFVLRRTQRLHLLVGTWPFIWGQRIGNWVPHTKVEKSTAAWSWKISFNPTSLPEEGTACDITILCLCKVCFHFMMQLSHIHKTGVNIFIRGHTSTIIFNLWQTLMITFRTRFFVRVEFEKYAVFINPYPTAFPYGNGMVLHFYQQQESSTTKTVHKVINKGLKAYV